MNTMKFYLLINPNNVPFLIDDNTTSYCHLPNFEVTRQLPDIRYNELLFRLSNSDITMPFPVYYSDYLFCKLLRAYIYLQELPGKVGTREILQLAEIDQENTEKLYNFLDI